MGVLGPARAAKVLDLHDLGQHGLVEFVLQGRAGIVAFVKIFLEKETEINAK